MGECTPDDAPSFDYDIAVSFAGEDRDYVEEVVGRLKGRGFKVFYDQDQQAELWGVNLVDALGAVYTRRARFAALFISRHYAEKKWPTHERQSAQACAVEQNSPYILPIRLDDTDLPGLHSTIGYIDARRVGIDELVELFFRKLASGAEVRVSAFSGRAPRTAQDIASLLAERPSVWEYLLYAGALRQGIASLEEKYRDHVLEFLEEMELCWKIVMHFRTSGITLQCSSQSRIPLIESCRRQRRTPRLACRESRVTRIEFCILPIVS
ncbi:toll/interleukin-1 receptor domain-containing protein [Amycolatopsis sp. NBC_01286]|uniref:toll/interleukin-1 receptor domain-containing protein n=1 Tax=Amycolatopsis sp. NBC_01286 TaxID=2903560 RepID=UPI002E0D47F1|nr:TIR domain-containing protein [Amycolatopsis sp. NBC_01286]